MNARKKLKQMRLEIQPQRLAAVPLPSADVPTLPRVLNWARVTHNLQHVMTLLDKYPVIMTDNFMRMRVATSTREAVRLAYYEYNFAIRLELVLKLKGVVEYEKNEATEVHVFYPRECRCSTDRRDQFDDGDHGHLSGTVRFTRYGIL